ncbi:primosomal replication protein PriC [Thalassotalea psychrophila]|uniref:Primosomal replication protein PriC n=1 Tax=Thalassotalea psychrophila TaxID=3065647 RepID=A0ABY9TRI1_9GAMM|nr:primosomal replication protein PriC [Colwelliaceae bacterium SQ149]
MERSLTRLKSILDQLETDANAADQANKQRKSHYYLQDEAMFDEKLFPITSSSYYAYVKYTQKRLDHLQQLLNTKHRDFCDALMAELEEQISSLITAIKSNDSRHHDSEYRLDRRNRLNKQKTQAKAKHTAKFKNQAKAVLMSSHQLYAKLAEFQGFERRLQEMIRIKEHELAKTKKHDTATMQQEILTLHQRLGRCRKAISDVEKQIEDSEKR